MDIKILDKPAYSIDNHVLENAMAEYIASNHDLVKLAAAVDAFRHTDLIVPVAFPKNTDLRILDKMLRGEPMKKSEGINMLPITLSDPNGNKFAPAFTSKEQIKEVKDFPFMIRVKGEAVITTAANEKLGLTGILLNPQTNAFMFKNQAFVDDLKKIAEQQKSKQIKKVSKEEFAVLARNSVEKALLPKMLFDEKAAFIQKLTEGREGFLKELYSKPYGEKLPSPYEEDDFNIMELDINDETTAFSIELPQKNLIPQLALSAYIIWNPKTEESFYYMIEKGVQGESDVLCRVAPDGKHTEEMTAPPVGSELSTVLELVEEERAEAAK